jgi:hypothetical protein
MRTIFPEFESSDTEIVEEFNGFKVHRYTGKIDREFYYLTKDGKQIQEGPELYTAKDWIENVIDDYNHYFKKDDKVSAAALLVSEHEWFRSVVCKALTPTKTQ